MADIVSTLTGGAPSTMSKIGDVLLNILIIVGVVGILAMLAYFGWIWFRKWRAYHQYKVLIFSKNILGHFEYDWDSAGIFLDKALNAKRFYLKRGKSSLSADNVPIIRAGRKRLVFLRKISSKNYRFIYPTIKDDKVQFLLSEDDVNWALEEYETAKKRWFLSWITEWKGLIIMVLVFTLIVVLSIKIIQGWGNLEATSSNILSAVQIQARMQEQLLTNTTRIIYT